MILSFFLTYKNLILHSVVSLSAFLILTVLRVPIRFLEGLYTYIHPENIGNDNNQSGLRAAIRRPESTESSSSGLDTSSKNSAEPKKRNRSKEKFEFDESKAQIFRLLLVDSHLQSRLYFSEYRDAFIYSTVALLSLLLHKFLSASDNPDCFISEATIPVILGFIAVWKVIVLFARVSFERSASKRLEKQLSVIVGSLGFLFVLAVVFVIAPSIFDFDLDSIDGFGKVSVAVLVGFLTGFLFMSATKTARSFWLGTDQLRWNLSIISCGWITRMLLYFSFMVTIFTSLLWLNPLAEILVNKKYNNGRGNSTQGARDAEKLAGNIGMARSDFLKLRLLCLLASGVSQIVVLRPNLQMYLNEAVLSWYQRLHSSKVPDLDFSRAKLFLQNYYLCLAVLQFFAPAALVLLFLGLSQIDGDLFGNFLFLCSIVPCSSSGKEIALFLSWWIVFAWAIFNSSILVLYRYGFLYVS